MVFISPSIQYKISINIQEINQRPRIKLQETSIQNCTKTSDDRVTVLNNTIFSNKSEGRSVTWRPHLCAWKPPNFVSRQVPPTIKTQFRTTQRDTVGAGGAEARVISLRPTKSLLKVYLIPEYPLLSKLSDVTTLF